MRIPLCPRPNPNGSLPLIAVFFLCLLYISHTALAIDLDVDNDDSIKQAAKQIASNLWNFYNTTTVPGNLPAPYYWWQAGAMLMTMIEYWYYTGDEQYNSGIIEGIQWQVGPDKDFMTPNQTRSTGNDDQAFWGFAALDAAEFRFPNPQADQPQWLALAQGVFNTQAARWNAETCGGGLRWQVFFTNAGWNYKNLISNGCFFTLAARLGRYTGNETYIEWGRRMYDWIRDVQLVDDQYNCYDGVDVLHNCSTATRNSLRFSYLEGVMLHGAANMWNHVGSRNYNKVKFEANCREQTQDQYWRSALDGLLKNFQTVYVRDGIIAEVACEPNGRCNNDQRSFKAYTARWLAATVQLAPWTGTVIMPILRRSALAAAETGCAEGQCILAWNRQFAPQWQGRTGPGENMAALSVIASNLIGSSPPIVSERQGGISKGDPSAGGTSGGDPKVVEVEYGPLTTADRAGAGILTVIVLGITMSGCFWMVSGFKE